jgi:hypothetical protein
MTSPANGTLTSHPLPVALPYSSILLLPLTQPRLDDTRDRVGPPLALCLPASISTVLLSPTAFICPLAHPPAPVCTTQPRHPAPFSIALFSLSALPSALTEPTITSTTGCLLR